MGDGSTKIMARINANLELERKWAENADQRLVMAAGGQTFSIHLPGHVPAWVPSSAAAQPPTRHDPFFQFLEPLKSRFIKWLAYLAKLERPPADEPKLSTWWPLLWATDIDQYERPFSCPALAAYDWPDYDDDVFEP